MYYKCIVVCWRARLTSLDDQASKETCMESNMVRQWLVLLSSSILPLANEMQFTISLQDTFMLPWLLCIANLLCNCFFSIAHVYDTTQYLQFSIFVWNPLFWYCQTKSTLKIQILMHLFKVKGLHYFKFSLVVMSLCFCLYYKIAFVNTLYVHMQWNCQPPYKKFIVRTISYIAC